MDRIRRSQYLEALGIEQWVPRHGDRVAAAASPVAEAPPPEPAVHADPAPPAEAVVAAADAAHDEAPAPDWDTLQALVRDCTRCPLHQTRTHAVFGAGVREGDLMVLGEGPGAEEDRRGEAFVGRAGKLLDAMLQAIGRDRGSSVFITNIVKCRPPKNRDPLPDEAAACRGYLDRQLELVRPRAILAVGRVAAQNLLGTGDAVGRLRGRVHRHGASGTPVVVSYHPAYLLRSPLEKRKAWDDLKLIRSLMEETS